MRRTPQSHAFCGPPRNLPANIAAVSQAQTRITGKKASHAPTHDCSPCPAPCRSPIRKVGRTAAYATPNQVTATAASGTDLYVSDQGKWRFVGVSKSVVFGVLVALVGCLRGMQSGRSAEAVGRAATSAVVTSIVLIVVIDGIFAVILNVLHL